MAFKSSILFVLINLFAGVLAYGQTEAQRLYADSLARVLYEKGSYDSAAMYFHYAVNTGAKLYGDYDKNVEVGYFNAGYAYKKAGKCKEALPFLQNSLIVYKHLYGIDSSKYKSRLTSLAECSYEIEKNKSTKSYYMDLAYLSDDKELKAKYLNKITLIDGSFGHYDTAAQFAVLAYQQAKDLKTYTIEYPSLYAQNAGYCFFQINQLDSGKKYYEIAIQQKLLESKTRGNSYYTIIDAYTERLKEKKLYKDAIPHYISLLAYSDTSNTYDSAKRSALLSDLTFGYYHIANKLYNSKRFEEAAEQYKNSLSFFDKQSSQNWVDRSSLYQSIAMSYSEIKAYDSTEAYVFKQTKLYEENNYNDSLSYGLAVKYLGLNQLQGKNYTDAINNYKIALNVLSNYDDEKYTNYLYTLSELRHCYRRSNEPYKAIYYGEKAVELSYLSKAPYNLQLEYLHELGQDYYENDFCELALKNHKKVFNVINKAGLENTLIHADKYTSLGNQLLDCDKYEKAISTYQKAIAIYKQENGSNQSISSTYYRLGVSYQSMEKYELALKHFKSAKACLETTSSTYKKSLRRYEEMIGRAYEKLDSHQLAYDHYSKALELFYTEKEFSFRKEIDLVKNLITPAGELGLNRIALNRALEYQDLVREEYGTKSYKYFTTFLPLAIRYMDLKENDSAMMALEQGFEISVLNELEDSSEYNINKIKYEIGLLNLTQLKSLLSIVDDKVNDNELAESFISKGKSSRALQLIISDEWLSANGTKKNQLAEVLNVIGSANFNLANGSLKDAASEYQQILNSLNNAIDKNSLASGLAHKELGTVYTELREYNAASNHLEQSLLIIRKHLSSDSKMYIEVELDQVELFLAMGKYDKAMEAIAPLTERTQNLFGVSSSQNLRSWLYWGLLNQSIKEYKGALDAYSYVYVNTEKNDSLKLLHAKVNHLVATLLNVMGKNKAGFKGDYSNPVYIEQNRKENKKALNHIETAEEIYLEIEGEKSPKLALVSCHKAFLLGLDAQIDEANELYDFYLPILKNRYGAQHPAYGDQIRKIGDLNYLVGDNKLAAKNYKIANEITMSEIQGVFAISTEAHRQAFYESLEYDFDKLQQFNRDINYTDSEITAICLNNHLTLKSLLLQNQKAILANLNSLKKEIITKTIEEYVSLKDKVFHQLELPKDIREKGLVSQINLRDSLENLLIKKHIERFPNFRTDLVSWHEIKDNLKDDEVAIEFSQFHFEDADEHKDSIIYVAYIIKNNLDAPKVISLFKEHELETVLKNNRINNLYVSRGARVEGESIEVDEDVYNLVWKPLQDELTSSKKVYYSVSGILNKVPIAALTDQMETPLCQKYDLVQYSTLPNFSSKTLTKKSATLIGSVDYSYVQPSPENKVIAETWKYLEGTKEEVNSISNSLKANKFSVKLATQQDASESYIKNLDGQSPPILHIATHGFYKPDTSTVEGIERIYLNYASDPMMRSGLILAGGNYAWQEKLNPHVDEDGILRATEIANLNFTNTKLVVLSACETGLGDIDGNEGVYGLQRGFKMAGVDKMILSLWEVPDAETSEFMQLFYKHLIESKDIRNAFNSTQREMQTKYSSQPYLWAGFILVE